MARWRRAHFVRCGARCDRQSRESERQVPIISLLDNLSADTGGRGGAAGSPVWPGTCAARPLKGPSHL